MTGNRIGKYLLGAVSVYLLCGCTAEPVVVVEPQDARLVEVSIAPPDLGIPISLTRTALSEQLPAGATVRIAAYYLRKSSDGVMQPASFETSPPTYQATYEVRSNGSLSPCGVDADGKKISDTAPGLTVRGGTYDFYAVSPARRLQQGSGNNYYRITNIPHKEDVMTSYQRNVTVMATSNTVTLNTFTRKCALVVFNVKPSKENALPFVKLYGTSLILKKISTSGASLTAGGSAGIPATGGSTGVASEVTFAAGDFEPVSGDNPTKLNKAKGVLLPTNNTAFDVSLTVQRDNETATLSATIDKQITFDPGKRYIFTLEVKNNTSRLQMTVLNWTPVSFTDTGVGSPDPDRPTDPEIDPGTGTTITVAQWDNIPWTGNGLAGNSSIIRIDEKTLKNYYTWFKSLSLSYTWNQWPPFNADGSDTAASHGVTVNLTDTPTMTGSYRVRVQQTRDEKRFMYDPEAKGYCSGYTEDGLRGWRLPTMIELFAMWDKAKGTNANATDKEPESKTFGFPFVAGGYWSSSVPSGNGGIRCGLGFGNGTFNWYGTNGDKAVRCVRDIK